MMADAGILARFGRGLARTRQTLSSAFSGALWTAALDEEAIDEIEQALYGADFGVETTSEIIGEIRAEARRDRQLAGRGAARIGAGVLAGLLREAEGRLETGRDRPRVICLVGANGTGKTTTAAKLAFRFEGEGMRTVLGACDTFRAAANEQIQMWAERLGLELVAGHPGADAAAVAYDAYEATRVRERDLLILDTAGRLHTKGNLMDQLGKIRRVLQKIDPDAPHQSWIVIDGTLGGNSIEQARVFHREFGLNGAIVTKLDGTSRGGALVGIHRELQLPIYFVGLGEEAEDLQPFSAVEYANTIFGLEDAENPG